MRAIRFSTISKYYWLCQIGGWSGIYGLILTLNQTLIKSNVIEYAVLTCLSGLLVTHLLRIAIRRFGWLNLPPKKGLVRLLVAVVLASTLAAWTRILGIDGLNRITAVSAFFLRRRVVFGSIIEYAILITSWALIYCFYVYIEKNRKESLEKRRLEQKLQLMKQQAGESAVDVDFLIDSLHRIQSSIEENPTRSRAEITAFSNLLRRGFLTPE
jgi:hypothetical protein